MPFLDKLVARDIYPVTFMHIACVDNKERTKFIARANYILDKNVLRFTMKIMILFLYLLE